MTGSIPTGAFSTGTNFATVGQSTSAANQAANAAAVASGTLGSSSATGTSSTSASANLSIDLSQFLSILTTELQNQDPTQPMDPSQTVGQLATLTQTQAAVTSNQLLTQILANQTSSTGASLSGYIGDVVTANSSSFSLSNSTATIGYTTPANITSANIVIKDSSGNQVYTSTGNATAGNHTLTWNGLSSSGAQEPDGNYTVTVNTVDNNGTAGTATTVNAALVTGVDLTNSTTPELVLGNGSEVPLSAVQSVQKPASSSSSGS